MRPPKKPRLDVTSGSDGDRSLNGAIPVVGIGSSAGGIEALRSLVPEIQRDSGLAYVIVPHLDPDHASKLTEILGRVSKIPVAEIDSETRIESNCIYVLPPNAAVTIENDRLLLTGPVQPHGYRTPIDGFLVSLAESKSELAACVILSGTGSDGTLGLRAIKEHGGFTLAQDGAQYDGMMRSAFSTGLVDFVLPAAEISAKLTGYFRHVGDAGQNGQAASALADHVPEICRLLRARTGHDFSGYKDKTIIRRVQRRMQVLQIESAEDFVALLRKRPQELDALLQDLLIGVTNFFRDPAAFELLERDVIPKLFLGKGQDDSVRVWIPGCSTGEEAYSIAILLKEYVAERPIKPKLQVFASDIDEHSLQIARMGRYPAAIAKDVSPRRLDRHFVREDGTYRISTELREMCLFSQHNLLRDAPFSKLDLVSCRNLLIYLTGELQNRLIPLFRYALNTGGFLFLGSSENVTRHTRLFETEDKTHRIFQRRHLIERRLPEFPLTAPERARLPALQTGRAVAEQETLQGLAERQLLERYAPPYVVINGEGELIHASTRTGKYLELAAGVPKTDIFGMARRGLRAELRAGVHKAAATGTPVVQPNVAIGTNGGRQNINLIVHPIRSGDGQSPLFMVVFQDAGPLQAMREEGEPVALEEIESSTIQQLETELRSTKDRLQTTTEELESSNEELKSGNEELSSMNEELQSANEELQSANEELETSKEELQSINEELQTVNAELNARVDELSRANSDIANLLESTQIATVFLDRDLTVKSFTPAAKDVFRLVESDTGRSITHVRARFASDTLQADTERVLRTLGTIERQVESTHNGARYVMRILPYRTVNNVISGVVITFTDVSKISAAEARIDVLAGDLRERMQNLETLIDLVPVGILFMEDSRSGTVKVNHTGARLLGETVEMPGLSPVRANWQMIENGHPLPPDEQPVQRALRTGEPVPSFEGELIRADGSRVPVLLSATPLTGEDGKSRGAIAAILDISQRKRDQAQQQVLLHELQHRVKNVIATIGALATRMMKSSTSLNEFATAFSGRLSAMARTHELLNSSNWTGAGLRPLIDNAIRSYTAPDNGNISISGPDVMLAPSAASTLGLVFYELASNAVKYGALREGAGQVKIIWDLVKQDSGSTVDLRWTERDGPPIAAAIHDGFGSSFIKRSVEYELGGKVILEFHALGLECRIQFPVRRNVLGNAGQPEDSTDAKPLAGKGRPENPRGGGQSADCRHDRRSGRILRLRRGRTGRRSRGRLGAAGRGPAGRRAARHQPCRHAVLSPGNRPRGARRAVCLHDRLRRRHDFSARVFRGPADHQALQSQGSRRGPGGLGPDGRRATAGRPPNYLTDHPTLKELPQPALVGPDDRIWGGTMLRFVGDVGIYLPDRDAIVFTALDGRMPVACRVRRSALTALGCSFRATPGELVDGFQSVRKFLERIVRFKWKTGRIARGANHQPVVNIEDADIYSFYSLKDGEPIAEIQVMPDDKPADLMWNEDSGSRLRLNLHSLRILVVEDNLLTGDAIHDLLETSGCEVVGPAPNVTTALDLIARTALDGAVLDVRLGDELSFPVAAALIERDIPFLFLTGYDDFIVPPQYRGTRRLDKPSDLRQLAEIVTSAFGQPSRFAH